MILSRELADILGPGRPGDVELLAAVHVSSNKLDGVVGTDRPEQIIHQLLRDATPQAPARIFVHGKTGSGKSSLIFRMLAELSGTAQPAPQAMILRCGDNIERLASIAAFGLYIVDELRAKQRFASLPPDQLAKAATTQQVTNPVSHGVSASASAGVLTAGYDWKKASTSYTLEVGSEERLQVLRDQLVEAGEAGERMIVVIDDTNRFATQGPGGQPNPENIANLFNNGLGFLIEQPLSVIAAVHPAYRDEPAVREIGGRGGFDDVEVHGLPNDTQPPPLATILNQRLEHAGHTGPDAGELFETEALVALQGPYFTADARNLRNVLTASKISVEAAVAAGQDRVRRQDAEHALTKLPPPGA